MITTAFTRFAAAAAVASALVAVAYSVTFGYYVQEGDRWAQYVSSGLLMVGGLVGLPVLIALYQRLRRHDEGFALLALAIGLVSAFGSVLHGAHDVAVFANEREAGSLGDVPSFTDPRGFATFALFGLGLAVLSALAAKAGFPKAISTVGLTTAALVIVVYIGRVTILNPKEWWNATAAVLSGLVGVPLWNLLIAKELRRLAHAQGQREAHVRASEGLQPNTPASRNDEIVLAS